MYRMYTIGTSKSQLETHLHTDKNRYYTAIHMSWVCLLKFSTLQTPAITLPTKAATPAPEPKKEIQPEETLEDFEQEAFDALQKRNQSKGMKRPASAKASAKVAAASKKATKALKLGCRKCRGAKAGCEQCRNPGYTGQRLTKEQWKSLAKKTGLK